MDHCSKNKLNKTGKLILLCIKLLFQGYTHFIATSLKKRKEVKVNGDVWLPDRFTLC